MLAQSLLVLKLTGRASALGEATAIQAAPFLLLGPFIGPAVRWSGSTRLRVVIVDRLRAAGVEASAGLAVLTETHHVTIWWIFGLSFLLGCINMFNQPAIQAFVAELVPRPAIPSAVSLNPVSRWRRAVASQAQPLAALLYSWKGPATCFAVNAASYVIVIVALLMLGEGRALSFDSRQRTRGGR